MENKTTIIVPAAGKSSRFPNMRPKWLLTHPNGKLMIENALSNFLDKEYRIVLVTTKEIAEQHDVSLILQQLFGDRVELFQIPHQTKSPSETINYAIENYLKGDCSIIIKDSDGYVDVADMNILEDNFCIGVDLATNSVNNIIAKSFLKKDKNNIINDIVEKRISSNYICAGVYGFKSSTEFSTEYHKLTNMNLSNEIFVSHIVYSMIIGGSVFKYVDSTDFKDWGTMNEWTDVMNNHQTIFCDYDGVLVKNKGKFGVTNWYNSEDEAIEENVQTIKQLVDAGATLIITTSRYKSLESKISQFLDKNGISNYTILCGLPHARRVLINDYANTNPYPSAISLNLERNGSLNKLTNSL